MSAILKHKEHKMTADELWRMPHGDYRSELIDGELIQMAPTGEEHGRCAIRLSTPLAQHIYANKLGEVYAAETGFKIDRYTVRAPDISFISYARLDAIGRTPKFFSGAPDLAVEVVSPDDRKKEVRAKAEWWLQVGAQLVWVVEPKKKTVTAYYAGRGIIAEYGMNDTIDGLDVIPRFKLPVRFIFAEYVTDFR